MEIRWKTRIAPQIKKRALYSGFISAFLGISFITIFSLLPPSSLLGFKRDLGWMVFFFGYLLIYLGYIPYKRLARLESYPNTLEIKDLNLDYFFRKNWAFSIPTKSIERIEYRNGIKIHLKSPLPEKLRISDEFQFHHFLKSSKGQKCDLFFPHFEKSAEACLQDIVHSKKSGKTPIFEDREDCN